MKERLIGQAIYRRRQLIERIIVTCPNGKQNEQLDWLYEHGYRNIDIQRQWRWDKDARNEQGYPIKRMIYLDRWTLTGERFAKRADNGEAPTK